MQKLFFQFLTFALILLLPFGCSNDDSTGPGNSVPQTVQTTISGTVLNQDNSPVAGANVTCAGQTVITSSQGSFTFSNINVPKDRYVVNAEKTGYFKGSVADAPKASGSSIVEIYLIQADVVQTVSASSGGNVEVSNGTGVEIASNSVVKGDGTDYTGDVNVSVSYLDPTSEDFSNLIPGGDMLAQTASNTQVSLYSYGIIKVDMTDDAGEKLQIKNGSSSTITVDIPSSMEGTAPSTIPLWYYDDATGLWKEEGTATKQGDKYVGTVTHFSDWNCDTPEGTATVKGLVVDCNNLPVPGLTVKIGQASAITGSDGRFERRVPANTAFEVQVLGTRNFGLTSPPVAVPPLAEGQVYDVGSLTVDCPAYVKGVIRCGTEKKYGQVVISWTGGYNTQFTDDQGAFNLPVDIGKPAYVSIYTIDNKYKSIEITTPSVRGETLDLGNIEVCEQTQTGVNKFTLNGAGFNNKTFEFYYDTLQVYGFFDPQDTSTFIWMQQVFQTDTIMFWLSFKGDNLGAASDVYFYLYHNSSIHFAGADLTGTTTSANITKYSGVGGLLEGTFNGTLSDLYGVQPDILLTNGQFSVIRRILEKTEFIRVNKIPKEIKEKIPYLH